MDIKPKEIYSNVDISIIIPVRNEEYNLCPLFKKVMSVMVKEKRTFEIIIVNDNSTDNTLQIMREIKNKYSFIKVYDIIGKHGKDNALSKGFLESSGDLILTMDGDFQNDPDDIPLLIKHISGYDMVCGIRAMRHDPYIKIFISKIANTIRNFITVDNIVDSGCALRLFRKKHVNTLIQFNKLLYGTAHCFYPTILKKTGGRVKQIPVMHHSRKFGKSKFKLVRGRTFNGFLACMIVRRIGMK